MRMIMIRLLLIMAFFFSVRFVCAQDVSYEDIVRGNLKNMTKLSGTFDLYDSEADQIRNLRMIEILPEIRKEGESAFVPVRFRDINTGDIVFVEVKVKMISAGRYDSQWKIKEVQKLQKDDAFKKDKYSDEEIQQTIRDYIDEKSKFTGSFMLFDPKAEIMRKLQLLEMKAEVRRYGILSIVTARFQDTESQEKLTVDINVKNKKGELEVETLKIKKVRK